MPGQKELVREGEIEALAEHVAEEIASHASEGKDSILKDKPKDS